MFMQIAQIVAQRGTCDRASVGAVLVNNNRNIVAIGYNGAPAGEPHCDEVGHKLVNNHCTNALHAEENCLEALQKSIHYDRDGYPIGITGYHLTLYVTHYPCMKCVHKVISAVNVGGLPIGRIVYLHPFGDNPSVRQKLLKGAGISIERHIRPEE